MRSLTKRLLLALAAATLAGSGVAAGAALPATATATASATATATASATVTGRMFTEVGVGLDEATALANGESAARASAAQEGFTDCNPFEEVSWQSGKVWFAQFTILCQDSA
ncbi:hypothetical protein [Nonomuraea sp. NPDC050643]|uniref:hypothetical protein n=1 Tax=Nonomuraea sp. NPDC050643 TaxID=3155660 RepID=UPI0034083691